MPRFLSPKVLIVISALLILDLCFSREWVLFRPIFLYLWILAVLYLGSDRQAIAAAIFIGILRDLTGSQALGVETLTLVSLTFSFLWLLQKMDREAFLMRELMTFTYTFFAMIFNLILSGFLSTEQQFSMGALMICFTSALATALIVPFFFLIVKRLIFPVSHSLRQYELFS